MRPLAVLTTAVSTAPSTAVASAQAVWSPEIISTGAPKCPHTAAFSPISPNGWPLIHKFATRSSDQVCSRMAFCDADAGVVAHEHHAVHAAVDALHHG